VPIRRRVTSPPPADRPGGGETYLTVDVEEWFHVLDTAIAPRMGRWDRLEARAADSVRRLLDVLDAQGAKATFFWLGWLARRHPQLVRRCRDAGHEVASHGFAHVLAYQAGPRAFRRDVHDAKGVLEDILSQRIAGFRAPGFGITAGARWAFDVIREAGHLYDASVFPAARSHGGIRGAPLGPHVLPTAAGPLVECPMSAVGVLGRRLCLFSGGYLRLAPMPLLRWGEAYLRRAGRPLVALVHPREIDPRHPRLRLGPRRGFKCYVNLRTTMRKFAWLCNTGRCLTLTDLAQRTARSVAASPAEAKAA